MCIGSIASWKCSFSVALPQPGPVLMSLAPIAIKYHVDSRGLDDHPGPCWCPEAMLPLVPCQSGWPWLPPGAMVTSKHRLLPRTTCESMVLPQSGSEFKSMHGLCSHQRPYGSLGSGPQPLALLVSGPMLLPEPS